MDPWFEGNDFGTLADELAFHPNFKKRVGVPVDFKDERAVCRLERDFEKRTGWLIAGHRRIRLFGFRSDFGVNR